MQLTLSQPMTHICVMSVLFFFHKSIKIYMEVIILGANTLYSVFCFLKTLLPEQVHFGMVGKGIVYIQPIPNAIPIDIFTYSLLWHIHKQHMYWPSINCATLSFLYHIYLRSCNHCLCFCIMAC